MYNVYDAMTHRPIYKGTLSDCHAFVRAFGLCYVG